MSNDINSNQERGRRPRPGRTVYVKMGSRVDVGNLPDVGNLLAQQGILVSPEKQTIELRSGADLPDHVPEGFTYEDIQALHMCTNALAGLWNVHRAMGRTADELVTLFEQRYKVNTDTIE